MKLTFDIDCTPDEARRFLGLPDIAPIQDRMMKELERKMQENIQTLDPETFIRTWMPLTIDSWTEMQKMMMAQMGIGPAPSAASRSKKSL